MEQLKVAVKQQWCERHWQPAANRMVNGIHLSILTMQAFVEDERVAVFCGYDEEAGKKARVSRLSEAAEHFGPICCFLGDELMSKLYIEAEKSAPPPDAAESVH